MPNSDSTDFQNLLILSLHKLALFEGLAAGTPPRTLWLQIACSLTAWSVAVSVLSCWLTQYYSHSTTNLRLYLSPLSFVAVTIYIPGS